MPCECDTLKILIFLIVIHLSYFTGHIFLYGRAQRVRRYFYELRANEYFRMVGKSESDDIFVYELRANEYFRMVGKSQSDDIFVY